MDFGFIIPACIIHEKHLKQLKRCLQSIKTHHPDKQIIIINDTPKTSYYSELKQFLDIMENITIVPTILEGLGELQTFKIFYDIASFNKAVILHDSMILLQPLNLDSIDNVKFLWYFTNHRLDWNTILEPQTEYNIQNHIITHNDLLRNCIMKNFTDDPEFQTFAINMINNPNKWCGCFGCCCIITKDAIARLKKYTDVFIKYNYNNRRARCAAESLFAIICHYVFPDCDFSKSYDGLYYDGINVNTYHNQPLDKKYYLVSDNLTEEEKICWYARNNYIGKLAFGR